MQYFLFFRWDKQLTPVPATFTFAILNSYSEKAFVVDVNERKMFGHAPGNSKELFRNINSLLWIFK